VARGGRARGRRARGGRAKDHEGIGLTPGWACCTRVKGFTDAL